LRKDWDQNYKHYSEAVSPNRGGVKSPNLIKRRM